MASYSEIQAKVRELQSDSLETIAETILDIEARLAKAEDERDELSDIKHQSIDIASIT